MTAALQLKPGDLIVATEISHYTHAGAEGKQSQWVGDMIMVNNPRISGMVGGTGIHDGPGKREPGDRPSLGLGCSLHAGTYRLATPDDPGFMATREVWEKHLTTPDQVRDALSKEVAALTAELNQERVHCFAWGAIGILCLGFTGLVLLAGLA
jgi:hypothetical protein